MSARRSGTSFLARFLCILALLALATVPLQLMALVWTYEFRWFLSAMVTLLSAIAVGYAGVTFGELALKRGAK